MQTYQTVHRDAADAVPGTELILAGNGPGELAGWIRPTAEAVRAGGAHVRLTLALLPTQFSGGAELETVRSWRLFDRIIAPMEALRAAAGIGSLDVLPAAALVHLGGDLWLSSALASHLGIAACAFSETTLIASRHSRFDRIFVPTAAHATALQARGVPQAKILITGDPRAAGPARARREANSSAAGAAGETIALLAGSRDRFFRAALPIFLDIAGALARIRPRASFDVIVAPFVTRPALRAAQHDATRRHPALPLRWVTGGPWPDLTRTTLALTLPGSVTIELAAGGTPFAVVVPIDQVGVAAVEGPLEWIARLTGLHRLVKRIALERYRRRFTFLALPNQRAGREVAPEWVGRWTAGDIANRLSSLLDDPQALADMNATLSQLYVADAPAPSRIAGAALELARSPRRARA